MDLYAYAKLHSLEMERKKSRVQFHFKNAIFCYEEAIKQDTKNVVLETLIT
jgi:hypothetical protein